MPLNFTPPPDWMIQEYMKRKHPIAEAAEGAQGLLGTYAALQGQQKTQQGTALANYLKLLETDPELANTPLGQQLSKEMGGGLGGYQPPSLSTAPTASPMGMAPDAGNFQQDSVVPPQTVSPGGSPILNHWSASRGGGQPQGAGSPQMVMGRGKMGAALNAQTKIGLDFDKAASANQPIPLFNKKGEPIQAQTESGLLPHNAKVLDDTAGRGMQFVGTQGNNAVIFDPNTGKTSLSPLPGGVPISPKIAPTIPGAEVSKFGELDNLKKKMVVLRENYKPEFVGMVDAPMQALKQRTGLGASKEASFFRQTSQDIKDSLLRARSGAQINEQEYKRLLPLVPNETMSEIDFEAKSERFDQVLNEIITSKQGAFQAAGYRTPDFSGGQQQPSMGGDDHAGKRKVSNGVETLWIDPADSAEAARDGYRQIQ